MMTKTFEENDYEITSSQYFCPLKKIKHLEIDDASIDECIKNGEPIVIKGTNLVQSAVSKWTLTYLKSHMNQSKYSVYQSKSNRFLYWDDKKLENVKNFRKPTEVMELNFEEFVDIIDTWSENDEHKYYLQQKLNNTVDCDIVKDYLNFNWKWVNERKSNAQWGDLTLNLLLISQAGNLTPCHYDEQENFFAQVSGYKHCVLFSPDMFKYLYPYPVYHPCDRQSMVDLNHPDFNLYPELKNLEGYETIVAPGDVLYIPSYWFHQIETLNTTPIVVSINFWFKAKDADPAHLEYPLKPETKIAMMRNIEKMVGTVLKNNDEMPEFFRTITLGRYTNL